MHATIITLKNPFRPNVNREISKVVPGYSIRRNLKQKQMIVNGRRVCPFFVTLNGKPIVEKQWGLKVGDDDILMIQHLPAGGGGSNPLQIILMIGVAVLSAYTGGAVGAAYGAAYGAAAGAAVGIAGSLILQMMFPPTSPSTGSATNGQASPTYTLAAQGNTARLMGAIPCLYGRMKFYPDFAATPYTEIQGQDQYLYQLFLLTQGEIDLEAIRIEDTDITNYDEVTYELVQPNQKVTLFPTNVDTSTEVASQQLYGPNRSEFAVIGPFVSAGANTTTNFLAVDISLPNGAYYANDDGSLGNASVSYQFDYAAVDQNGAIVGTWQPLVSNTITLASKDPYRLTHKIAVPDGRYAVRAQRTNNQATDTRTSDVIQWDNMRAYLVDDDSYGNVTMLAVVMKATNQLSQQSSRKINVIGTRKLKTWDAANGWSLNTVATRNPAWAIADVIKNATYGRNLPDSRFNLVKLAQLAQTWDARGDTFNYIFDTVSQLWDVLQKICKAGRAMPMYYAGLIDFIRNEPKSIPTAMFQPSNIIKGSFQTTYNFADVDTPDYVQIQFHNEEIWADDTVDCILPGGTANNPATVELVGVTNRDQAWREGITMAAINKLWRRQISLSTELEGMIPTYGDLCQLSHDVPAWGYSGRVISLDPVTRRLMGSEEFPFTPGSSHVVAFRNPDGSANGPYTVAPSDRGIPTEVVLQTTNDIIAAIPISDGIRTEYTMYQFGPVGRAGLLALAQSGSPQGDDTVALTFVNYDENVFAAETGGAVPDPVPVSNLPTQDVLPIIDWIQLQYSYEVGRQQIVCSKANNAQYYEFAASADGGQTWINFGTNVDPQMDVALSVGTWLIRARGVGMLKGPWTTASVNVVATTLPLVEIGSLTTTSVTFGVTLNWSIKAGNAGLGQSVEIWQGLTNQLGNAVRLGVFGVNTTTFTQTDMGIGETHYYWARVIDKANRPGPFFNNGVGIAGVSSSDYSKYKSYLVGQIDSTLLANELLTKVNNGNAAYAQATATTTKLAAMYTIKTQLTVDGRTYIAGIGVSVENNQGVIESTVLLAANRFAILNPSVSGSARYPFIISGGVVFMDTAMIQDATITNAKIANATITTAKIGDAQITNAKIADAQINAAKIIDGEITNAKIQNAAISNAKIGNAEIDTLKLGANAVTTMVTVGGTTDVSTGYTASGGSVMIIASGVGSLQIQIDGGTVSTTQNAGQSITTTCVWSGGLAAGGHTIRAFSTIATALSLTIFEAKR